MKIPRHISSLGLVGVNLQWFRKLAGEKKAGFGKKLLRFFLKAACCAYSAVVVTRNFCYDRKLLKTHIAKVPVISIGNVTAGGTGKTPLVIWICNYLKARSLRCAILTRGYKTAKGALSDEPAILAKSCPDAKVIVNPDRVAGADKAIEQFSAQVLVMDDGFQHRRLARNLNIVTIDATCPFGYERLLPAGFLREPLCCLGRADAAVITRSDLVEPGRLAEIEEKLKSINPEITIAKSVHKPLYAKALKGRQISLDELRHKKIVAFCGLGNPEAFGDTLKRLGLNVLATRIYNDHHKYSQTDIADIYEQAIYLDADVILSTRKDWVKTALPAMDRENILFAYLDITLEFVAGQDRIKRLIDDVL